MYISDIKKEKKVSCSILPVKYLQAMLYLPAPEKKVYTSNTKDATHHITKKIIRIKHQQDGKEAPATTAGN